jgi:hypothetical protein
MFFTAILALGLRTLLSRGNKRFDLKYGTVEAQIPAAGVRVEEEERRQEQAVAVEDEGPAYRYVL